MAWIDWDPEYSVNIKLIDDQHKKLIGVINTLYDGLSGVPKGELLMPAKEIINKAIDELSDYTRYHFGAEEELMRKHAYPEYIFHKGLHDDFILKVTEFQDAFRRGKILTLSMEIIKFLRDWLINHILNIDHQYSVFFNQQGVY